MPVIAKLLTLLALIGVSSFSFIFYKRQNTSSKIGGKISAAKALWLGYAVYVYFLLAPIVLFGLDSSQHLKFILGGFITYMYFRGLAEIWLLYLGKHWSPKYGITHNISSLFFIVPLSAVYWTEFNLASMADALTLLCLFIISGCLITDSVYAYKFYAIVREKTKGENAIWFADPDDPIFKPINKLTATLNVVFLFLLMALLIGLLFF